MKAVTFPTPGGPAVLTLQEVDAPSPAPGEVTIDVAYAGVTFADVLFRRGTVPVPLPMIPGLEVSGWIREVGEGVTGLAPGQPCVALTLVAWGGYAEVVAVDAQLVAPLPGGDDDLLRNAAGAATNTTTAVLALSTAGRLAPDETLLVHAAASGLGSQIGQVAASMGTSNIIGTVGSTDKINAALGFGYTSVVLREDWLRDPGVALQPDVIIDQVGGPARSASLDHLSPGGRLVIIGNASDEPQLEVGTNDLFYASRTVAGFSVGALATARPHVGGQALAAAMQLVVNGSVKVDVNTVLPLDGAAEAHERIESGATTGKTVLAVTAR